MSPGKGDEEFIIEDMVLKDVRKAFFISQSEVLRMQYHVCNGAYPPSPLTNADQRRKSASRQAFDTLSALQRAAPRIYGLSLPLTSVPTIVRP
jgi:hypothetical protein